MEVGGVDAQQPRAPHRDGLALERRAGQQRHLAEELPLAERKRVDNVLRLLAARRAAPLLGERREEAEGKCRLQKL